ncbi:MAG: cellulose-binding protein CttA-related protein, partial [Oscillospiraceae bacterium]|nr:cellulose-binding protein CttA-related protein [Oscillospiraceae bacterium]
DLFESVTMVETDETGAVIESTRVDIMDQVNFNGATPLSTYAETPTYFVGTIQAYYNDGTTNTPIDGATPTVYIGVKGDTNLSGLVQVEDAVIMLSYYARASADLSPKFVEDDELLNKFVYFLSDIDTEAKTGENVAGVNTISVEDAVSNLAYYAQQSAALDPKWPDVVPSLKSLEGSCWYEG